MDCFIATSISVDAEHHLLHDTKTQIHNLLYNMGVIDDHQSTWQGLGIITDISVGNSKLNTEHIQSDVLNCQKPCSARNVVFS